MQDKSQSQPSQQNQHEQSMRNMYYRQSVINPSAITDICSELTSTEILDENVIRYLIEMGDNFISTTLESACNLAKNKNSDKVEPSDLASAIYDNFGIYEPSSSTSAINLMNINNLKSQATSDHQKRMELTKEETKNVNI